MASTNRYRITLTVEVEEGHVAHDDQEWIADAAWGACRMSTASTAHTTDVSRTAVPS